MLNDCSLAYYNKKTSFILYLYFSWSEITLWNRPHEKENKFMGESSIRFHSLFRHLNGVHYYMESDAEPPFPPGLSQLNNILMNSS